MQGITSGSDRRLTRRQVLRQSVATVSAVAAGSILPAGALAAGNRTVAQAMAVWPAVPAFSPNNWLDHFAGPDVDTTKWTPLLSGSSTATVSDSNLVLVTPGNAASGVYARRQLDTTTSQLWRFCLNRRRGSGGFNTILALVNTASPPIADTKAHYDAVSLGRVGFDDQVGGSALSFSQWQRQGGRQFWNFQVSRWGPYHNSRSLPVQNSDYYTFGLQIDAPNNRWRFLCWGEAFTTAGSWTKYQGLRLTGMTDWVTWASQPAGGGPWLVVGCPFTDDPVAYEHRIEWADYAEGTPLQAWAGVKNVENTGHQIKTYFTLDGKTFVPWTRDTFAITNGSSYDAHEAHNPYVVDDSDGTGKDWLFYLGEDVGAGDSINVAFAPHATPQLGPWTKSANNPIYRRGPAGSFDDAQLNFPIVVKDETEADAAKRWKMLVNCQQSSEPGVWKTALATAPAPDGPWTKRGIVLDVGPAGAPDEQWARMQALAHSGLWRGFYEGHNAAGQDSLLLATSPDLMTWTKSGRASLWSPVHGADQALTADLTIAPGRSVAVADSSAFSPDATVLIDNDADPDRWVQARVRTKPDGAHLELYDGVTGYTVASGARIKQISSSQTWNARLCLRVGNIWHLYFVFWEPWSASPERARLNALYETCALMTHNAIEPDGATPVYQSLASPVLPLDVWVGQESVENLGVRLPPFRGG